MADHHTLSKKQEEILSYLKNEILTRGFPPSVREICEAVHLKSTSSVHAHLESLEKKGYIKRTRQNPGPSKSVTKISAPDGWMQFRAFRRLPRMKLHRSRTLCRFH